MITTNDQLKQAAMNADLSPGAAKLLQDFFLKLATPQQKEELDAWLNHSEANSYLFDLLLEFNRDGTTEGILRLLNNHQKKSKQPVIWIKRFMISGLIGFVLISLLDVVFPVAPIRQWLNGKPFFKIQWTRSSIQTQDQSKFFYLSDSTLVELLPNSRLLFPAELDYYNRTVWLKGDARFVVKRRPGEPFKVVGNATFVSTVDGEFSFKQLGKEQAKVSSYRGYISFGYDGNQIQGLDPGHDAIWMPGMFRLEYPINE